MSMIDIAAFDVYGNVSDQLAEVMGGFGAAVHRRLAGFVRQ